MVRAVLNLGQFITSWQFFLSKLSPIFVHISFDWVLIIMPELYIAHRISLSNIYVQNYSFYLFQKTTLYSKSWERSESLGNIPQPVKNPWATFLNQSRTRCHCRASWTLARAPRRRCRRPCRTCWGSTCYPATRTGSSMLGVEPHDRHCVTGWLRGPGAVTRLWPLPWTCWATLWGSSPPGCTEWPSTGS